MWNFAEGQPQNGFTFVDDEGLLIDERSGGSYFWITYLPKYLGGGTFYLTGLRDADGALLNGQDTYKLNVPGNTPAKDFWSVIVYSMRTKGFILDAPILGISDLNNGESLKYNEDGSADIYFSPTSPKGMENNWIPTGEDFFLIFRLYGPDKPLFEKHGPWEILKK